MSKSCCRPALLNVPSQDSRQLIANLKPFLGLLYFDLWGHCVLGIERTAEIEQDGDRHITPEAPRRGNS